MIRQEHVLATGTTLGQFCNIPLPWFGWTSVGWFGVLWRVFWRVAWHRCHLMSAQQATQRAKLLLEVHIKHQSQRFGQYFLDFQGPMCMPIGRFGSFNAGWERFCHIVTITKLGANVRNVSVVCHMCVCRGCRNRFVCFFWVFSFSWSEDVDGIKIDAQFVKHTCLEDVAPFWTKIWLDPCVPPSSWALCRVWTLGPTEGPSKFSWVWHVSDGKKHMCSDFMSLNGNHKKESPKSKHSNFGMFLW